MVRLLIFFIFCGVVAAEPPEKALRYHKILLKRPGDEVILTRFVQAWQEEASERELLKWLQEGADRGGLDHLRVLAAYQESIGRDKDAIASLGKAILIDEKDSELRLDRAKLQAKSLRFERAFEDLEVAEENPRLAKEAGKLRGSWLARSGKFEEAGEAWKAVIAANPLDEELREDLIELQVIEGLFKEAAGSIESLVAMTRDPYKKAIRQLRLAEVQVLGNERVKALEAYRKIMAATGGGTWLEGEVLAQTRRVFMKNDDVQGYRDFLQMMREEYPRRLALHRALARQLALAGEMKEAVELYREVIKMTPGNLGNLEGFIAFLEENRRWEEARVELKALLVRRNEDVELWKQLAKLEDRLNNGAGVEGALEEVGKLRAGSAGELINLSLLYGQYNLRKKAEEILRRGRDQFPDSDEVVEAYANMLVENGKRAEAREIWMGIAKSGSREELLRVSRSLLGQNMRSEALQVIADRMADFEEDVLVLTQLCLLVKTEEEARVVLPHALGLVRLATSPTELESSISHALSVIRIAKKKRETVDQLEKPEAPLVPDLCLLAELLDGSGESHRAVEMLQQVEGNLLGEFYRVSFDEKRGNLREAIERLEQIVSQPGQRKTVHLRRLAKLNRRIQNAEGAMKWVEEWKRLAPGDHLAWIVRSDLLLQSGRNEEAIIELTRLVGKFGPGEGRRVKLAEAQSRVGNGRAAQKLYRQLYEEAGETGEKLRWLSKWVQLAQSDGTLKEFIGEFQSRKQRNPKSIAPLLALAEIYGVLGRLNEQRMVLEEAADRRNTDPHLLIRLATLEEKAGNFDKAAEILKKADLVDRGEQSKRAMAALYLSGGRLAESLEVLKSIPSEAERPRQIEVRVQEVIKKGHWSMAEQYLNDLLPRFPDDWRLRYFAAILKKQDWKREEAIAILRDLEEVGNEIVGLGSSPGSTNEDPEKPEGVERYWTPGMWELWRTWGEITGGRRDLFDRENAYRVLLRDHLTRPFRLPVSAVEVRKKSFLWGLLLNEMEANPEKRDAGFDKIISRYEGDRKLFALAHFRPEKYRRELERLLEKDSGNLRLKQEWLSVEVEGDLHDAELLGEILTGMAAGHPGELLGQLPGLVSRKVIGEDRGWALARISYTGVRNEDRDEGLRNLLAFAGGISRKDERLVFLKTEILKRERFVAKPKDLEPLIRHALEAGDKEALVPLLNLLAVGMEAHEIKSDQLSGNVLMSHLNGTEPLSDGVGKMHGWSLDWLTGGRIANAGGQEMDEERKRELHEALGVQMKKGSREEIELMKALAKGDSRLLEGKVLMLLGKVGAAREIAEKMKGSAVIDEVYFVASFLARVGRFEESYALLVKLAGLIKHPDEHPEVALSTVNVAFELVGRSSEVKDLEVAREALARVSKRIDHRRVEELESAFGMALYSVPRQQVGRYSVTPVQLRKSATWTAGMKKALGGKSLAIQLVERLGTIRKETAIQVASIYLRSHGKSQWNRTADMASLQTALNSANLIVDFLEAEKPGENAGTEAFIKFARMSNALGRRRTAERYFQMALEMDLENGEALVGRAISGGRLADEAASVFSLRDCGEEAYHRVGIYFKQYRDRKGGTAEQLVTLEVMKGYLEGLPPGFDQEKYLSWVFSYMSDVLAISGASARKGNGLSRNSEKSFLAVLDILLNRSQFSEQAFVLLNSLRGDGELGQVELSKAANQSLRVRLQAKRPKLKREKLPPVYQPVDRKGNFFTWIEVIPENQDDVVGVTAEDLDYLLQYGGVGEDVGIDRETLAVMATHLPGFHLDFETARRMGGDDGVYGSWLKSLPGEPKEQMERTVSLLKCLIYHGESQGAWMEDFQDRFATAVVEGWIKKRSAFLVGGWFKLLDERGGSMLIKSQVRKLLEVTLGEEEKWPILVELGSRDFPEPYRQRFKHFSESLAHLVYVNQRSYDVLSELMESSARPLVSELRQLYLASWPGNGISGEQFFKLLKGNGILDRDKEDGVSMERFFLMAEALSSLPIPREAIRKELPPLVREDVEIQPFLREMLLWYCGDGNRFRELVDQRREMILAMEKREPGVARQFLERLYPGYAGSEVLGDVLERVKTRVLRDRVGALDQAIARGAFDFRRGFNRSYLIHEVAVLDIQAVARAVDKILLQNHELLGEQPVMTGFRRQGRTKVTMDHILESIVSSVHGYEGGPSFVAEWKFCNAICRGQAGELLESPLLGANLLEVINARDPFGSGGSLEERGLDMETLVELFENLTPNERHTCMVFYTSVLFGHWSNPLTPKDQVNLEERELYEKFPEISDLLCCIRLVSGSTIKDENGLRKRASVHLDQYLSTCDLPVILKMDLAYYLVAQSSFRDCLSGEVGWPWVLETMEEFLSGSKRSFDSNPRGLIERLTPGDFEKMGASLERFVEVASRAVLSDPASGKPLLNRMGSGTALISGALLAGKTTILAELLKRDTTRYEGSLAMIWKLHAAGVDEFIQGLLVNPGQVYSSKSLPVFSRDTKGQLTGLLEGIPQADRFRLEVLFSNVPDAEGGMAPKVPRAERMQALAGRFETEGPKGDVARLQVLHAFLSDDEAFKVVEEELREIESREGLGMTLRKVETDSAVRMRHQVIRKVVENDIGEGEFEGLFRHLRSLVFAGQRFDALAAEEGDQLMVKVIDGVLKRAALDPEEARDLLPSVRMLFEVSHATGRKDWLKVRRRAEALAVVVHALAGSSWEKGVEQLPEELQAKYQRARRRGIAFARLESLKTDVWISEENKSLRRDVVKILLANPYMLEEMKNEPLLRMGELTRSGFVGKESLMKIIDGMPDDHPKKARFLWYRGVNTKEFEKAAKVFEHASGLAREKMEDQLGERILFDYVVRAFEDGKEEVGEKILNELDARALNKGQRLRIEEMRAK